MFKYLFLSFFCLVSLSGCGTYKTYKTLDVQPVKMVKQTIPDELLMPCLVTPPPSQENYMLLKPHEREQTLTQYILSLYGDLKKCDSKVSKIKELNSSK